MKIPEQVLASLARISGLKNDLYSLDNVQVEREDREHLVAVALDGHMMLAARFRGPIDEEASDPPKVLIPAAAIFAVATDKGRCATELRVTQMESGEVHLCSASAAVSLIAAMKPEGCFPKWRNALPGGKDPQPIAFVNPRRLAALLLAIADAATDEEHPAVAITLDPDPEATIAVELAAGTREIKAFGILSARRFVEDRCDWRPKSSEDLAEQVDP